jgi:Family of unknown function (DUF6343)
MPIGGQPKGARGTVGHPYSALNLRLVLAAFGLVTCAVFAFLLLRMGHPVAGAVVAALAAVALVDLIVITIRRRRRCRTDPRGHSLFE